ncbi:ATP synthase gamma chain [Bizionia arctica]|uniref:ATP synthase gamma chain n=2 Tax=Bizionia arctica TaxID=1495645 RepID=A0A917GBN7_9FLAO|nr:ATP synthase gamma chain [Bizionia arctica]
MQITSAMKMVSAAKLKKAQDAITDMRPYADKLTQLLQSLSATLDADSGSKFSDQREVKNVLIVAITSNRGLCGAFNSNIIKEVNKLAKNTYANQEVSYLAIGKKANDAFKKTNKVIANESDVYEDLTFDNVAEIAQSLMDMFVAGDYDKIVIVYNKFKNAATQEIMTEQFLPIVPVEADANVNLDYIFEPSKIEIVEQLIPKSLKTQLYKGIRDSFASEHGARMTAMHKATDNATELRDQLKLTYNKARQASITNEILEIVGGAEALNN